MNADVSKPGPSNQDERVSKLAVTSIVVALMSCPFVLIRLLSAINQRVNELDRSISFKNINDPAPWFWPVFFGAQVFAVLLPAIALCRIWTTGSRKTGSELAVIAPIIMLIWWGLLLAAMSGISALGGGT